MQSSATNTAHVFESGIPLHNCVVVVVVVVFVPVVVDVAVVVVEVLVIVVAVVDVVVVSVIVDVVVLVAVVVVAVAVDVVAVTVVFVAVDVVAVADVAVIVVTVRVVLVVGTHTLHNIGHTACSAGPAIGCVQLSAFPAHTSGSATPLHVSTLSPVSSLRVLSASPLPLSLEPSLPDPLPSCAAADVVVATPPSVVAAAVVVADPQVLHSAGHWYATLVPKIGWLQSLSAKSAQCGASSSPSQCFGVSVVVAVEVAVVEVAVVV